METLLGSFEDFFIWEILIFEVNFVLSECRII